MLRPGAEPGRRRVDAAVALFAGAVDETIGERTFETNSSTELPTLDLTVRWSCAARLVKVRKGELSATQAPAEGALS